jgi:hypothetical protein
MVLPPYDSTIPYWRDIANGIGAWHMCALDYEGHAYCWGANWFGGLGNGLYDLYHSEDSNTPVKVLGNHIFKQISVGFHHTLAIKEDGEAYAWGGNQWGELGINQPGTTLKESPVQVLTTVRFLQIWAGHAFSVGLSEDYYAWAWGDDGYGQIGQDAENDGTGTEYHVPMSVITTLKFKSVISGRSHCVALAFDGSVWCWGSNTSGECGQDTNPWWPGVDHNTGGAQDLHWFGTPVSVKGNHSFDYIGAGYNISYGIKNDGSIWFWGLGIYGGIDWTGRELSGGEGDVGYIGYEDGDHTGKWASEDPYGISEMVIASPTESQWYREPQFPAGYHRNMNSPGVWYYHNDDYSFSYPEGCYWIIEVDSATPITITAELLPGDSEFDLRVFWDERLASGFDTSSIGGYTAIAYNAMDTGTAGDTLVVSTPLIQAGKYKPLMYWKSGTSGYRIKYELTYGSSTTTSTTV